MQITYQSTDYSPDRVTGAYVRVQGQRGDYSFYVMETIDGRHGPGTGESIREYVTKGEELPADLRDKCIKGKFTEKWF